jgi:hypothetical protein
MDQLFRNKPQGCMLNDMPICSTQKMDDKLASHGNYFINITSASGVWKYQIIAGYFEIKPILRTRSINSS